jgi:hypothetical protein
MTIAAREAIAENVVRRAEILAREQGWQASLRIMR